MVKVGLDLDEEMEKMLLGRLNQEELKKKAKEQEDWTDFEYDEEYDIYRFKD